MLETHLHCHIHLFQLCLDYEFLAISCVLTNPFLASYNVINVLSFPAHLIFFIFFKHTKHIVILTNSGNMSFLNQVRYYLPCISYLTLEIYFFILNSLYLIATIRDGLLQLCCPLVMLYFPMMACKCSSYFATVFILFC